MCGRYVEASPYSEIINWLDARATPIAEELYTPRWNISPTSTVLGMRMEDGERIVDNYRWGLVPSWVKELPRFASHNARVETVVTKPTFRSAWRARRRLLVPCQGYFEWQVLDDGPKPKKQPWYITAANEPQLAFAGLFDFWRPPGSVQGDPWLVSCTVITTDPGADVADIHDRQPVVLDRELWDVWLDSESSTDEARSLLVPAPAGTEHPPVSRTLQVGGVSWQRTRTTTSRASGDGVAIRKSSGETPQRS